MCECEINSINQYLSDDIFIFMMGIYMAFLLISYIMENKYYLYSLIAFFLVVFAYGGREIGFERKRCFLSLLGLQVRLL